MRFFGACRRLLWWVAMGKRSHMAAQANGSRDIHYNVLAYSAVGQNPTIDGGLSLLASYM